MRLRNLVLTITLGVVFTLGLLLALSLYAIPAEAQPAPASAAPTIDHSDAISKALAYIRTQQQPDGGIDTFGFGLGSSDGGTARAVLALVATGRPVSWMAHTTSSKTMIDYLAGRAVTYTHDASGTTSIHLFPDRAGLLLAATAAANEDPANFGGMDLIAQLNDAYHPATGAYSTTAKQGWSSGEASDLNQAWAILGLSAAGQPVPVTATNYLVNSQAADGSWAYGDPDTTAVAVVALLGSSNVQPTGAVIQKALGYFRDTQLPNGGWRPSWDTDPLNADTTGWAIQALVATGYTPATESWAHSPNPHTALLSLQQADGRIGGTYANAYSTIEALFGLTEQPLFFLGRTHRALRALTWMNEQQNGDGSWSGWTGPDPGATCDAVLAYAAAGYAPDSVTAAGSVTSAMDYLSSTTSSYVNTGPDVAGKLAVAVEAAGEDAHDFGSVNIVHVLTNTWYSPTLGAFGDANNSWHQAFAILGLAAAGEAIPVSATQTLTGLQQSDGSWTDAWGWSKPDSTGLALQALRAAGVPSSDTSVVSGTAFLRSQQDAAGGWSNANSTAYAMQGLLAASEDLIADWSSEDGHSPYDALAAYQKPDGPFVYQWDSPWVSPDDSGMATWQAVPALLGVHYPLSPTMLIPFNGVNRGPDPDRTVACPPRAAWGSSVDVIIPFGSDLDTDGNVTLDWCVSGESWVTGTTVYRADGYYTATLPVTAPVVYEFQATFTDPDGVQHETEITATIVLSSTLKPHYIYLPLVLKQ